MSIIRLSILSKSKHALLEVGVMEYSITNCDKLYELKICDIDTEEFGEDVADRLIQHMLEYLPAHDDITYNVERIDT